MWVDFTIGANQRGGIRILAATPQDEEEQALPADRPEPNEAVPETLTLFMLVLLLQLSQQHPCEEPLVLNVDIGRDLDLERDLHPARLPSPPSES
ncbi:hypothetical protein HPB52_018494 [Rhipicephalus sanguineus]|uniref:Uncharacterized protein n=1 Tax=Rhipicephalus sanguineus TaxID=34632 RepID=A0A9D4T605_RHISA|nr:hypothetical protein HPB52_018494 [Rhipicephalus sanguineus]